MAKRAGYKKRNQWDRRDKKAAAGEKAPGQITPPQEHLYSHQDTDGNYAYVFQYKQNGYHSRHSSRHHAQRRSQNEFQRYQSRRAGVSSGHAFPSQYPQFPQYDMTLYSPGFFQGYSGGDCQSEYFTQQPQFNPLANNYYGDHRFGNFVLAYHPPPVHSRVSSYQDPDHVPKVPFRLRPEAPEFVPRASKTSEPTTRQNLEE